MNSFWLNKIYACMDSTDCVPINLSDDEEVEDVADDDSDEFDLGSSFEGQNKGEGDHDDDNDDDGDDVVDDASKGTRKRTSPESGLFYLIKLNFAHLGK